MAGRDWQKAEISERRALRPPDSHTAGINQDQPGGSLPNSAR
jgi:hypothetical protein